MSRVIQKCSGLNSLHTKDCLLDFSQTKKQGVSAERERDWGEGEQKGRKRKNVHLDYKGANMHDFAIYIL